MQAEQYVDLLFGEHKGYVAVAAKNGEAGAWQEQVFLWPHDKETLLGWATANRRGDVFICPALRGTKGRSKNDGAHLQWLWADVDWQDVPDDRHADVQRRIKTLSKHGFVVSSGSGDNVHLYVRLSRVQTLDVWRRLNAGLRAYLSADAKHTDNALLRLPGTINHKPAGGRVTMRDVAEGPGISAATLLGKEEWKSVVITDERGVNDGAYDSVDVSAFMKGEVRRRVSMDVDEAVGRFGTRHGAVYQVASWLSKKGFTSDQIHTLMADFPAGLDKEEDERGYSLHVDIARCLAANPTVEALEVVEESAWELVDDGEPDDSMMDAARKRVRNWDIDDLAQQIRAQRVFLAPPDDVSYTMAERRATPRPPVQFAVEGIAAANQNVTITGQYKAGKTLLGLNLARSLVDGEPFLGHFKIGDDRGSARLGFWSLEMSMTDLDAYVDPLGITDAGASRLAVMNGRGFGVNVMTDVGRTWAVNWLKQWGCNTWMIDSHARMCGMSGVDENDNTQVLLLLRRLDEIKELAGIGELYYLVHTGRGETGSEGLGGGVARARGATVIDDWADARWVLTRQAAVRFLSVEGRSVIDLAARSIDFEPETGRMTLGSHDPMSAKIDGLTALVVSLVTDHPGEYNERALRAVVRERSAGSSQERIKRARDEAITLGAIRVQDGPRGEKRYWPSGTDEATVPDAEESGTVQRHSGGRRGATPREVNPRGLSDLEIRAEGKRRGRRK